MKKLILFFTNPIIGGILSLIGILEILFSIPSSYLNYRISLWIIVLVIGFIILALYLYKKLRILYFIKHILLIVLEDLVLILGNGVKPHIIPMFTDICPTTLMFKI